MRCRYAPPSRQGNARSADTVTPPGSTATLIASAETPGSAICTRTSSPVSMTSTGGSQACTCSAPLARRNCRCRRSACSRSDSASVHIQLEKSRDLTGVKWRRRKRLSSAAKNSPGSYIYRLVEQPLAKRGDRRALGNDLGTDQEIRRLRLQLHLERGAQLSRCDIVVDQRFQSKRHPQLLRRRLERQDVGGKMRPAAAVDAIRDAGRLQPLLPRVAVRDEVHRLVVQEHVVRQVRGLAQPGLVARELRAGDRDGGDIEQVIGAVAGIVAGAEMDLHAGDVVPQVEVSYQGGGIERAGVDHLARGEDAQLDPRLALGEIRQARKQPARGEDRRRGDQELGLRGALADQLHRRGERLEAFTQLRQAGARRFRELHPPPGAAKELHAEILLEALDLVADGGLRDGELLRRLLEREMARGGLEDAQCVQRRQTINHEISELFSWQT